MSAVTQEAITIQNQPSPAPASIFQPPEPDSPNPASFRCAPGISPKRHFHRIWKGVSPRESKGKEITSPRRRFRRILRRIRSSFLKDAQATSQNGAVEEINSLSSRSHTASRSVPDGRRRPNSTSTLETGSGHSLFNNAFSSDELYEETGDVVHLNDAIESYRLALQRMRSNHSMRDTAINNLALCLSSRYDKLGEVADLTEAIRLHQGSLELCPPEDPTRETTLSNLANCLGDRYEQTGDITDLEDAIKLLRESLDLCPTGHETRETTLSNLALCLSQRFDRIGHLDNLTEAITLNHEALELCPPGHETRETTLSNLALCLSARYDRTGDMADLAEAINLHHEGLRLASPGSPTRDISLDNLALYMSKRYQRTEEMEDLMEAIRLHQECLPLRLLGHPKRAATLNNLALCRSTRYDRTGDISDIDEAIILHQGSLDLCPPGHTMRDTILDNLALCRSKRYQRTKDMNDLLEAIRLDEESLVLRPLGHPSRSKSLTNLANSLSYHLETEVPGTSGHAASIGKIITMLRDATLDSASPTFLRVSAAYWWKTHARKYLHASELDAARESLNLLELAVTESASLEGLSGRLSEDKVFKRAQGVASDAAALAISAHDLPLAVSLLEQGRSTIFTQLGRYRSAIDDVKEKSPDLAKSFVELSAQLGALVVRGGNFGSGNNTHSRGAEDDASRHYRIHTAWSNAVKAIRELPGLSSFLLPPLFEQLKEAAAEGPVIIVNINEKRSDAIIVASTGNPVLVPLPYASPAVVRKLSDRLGERPAECEIRIAKSVLREVWKIIGDPVVTQLRSSPFTLTDGSRIWWCPTGVASQVPLHASGPYLRGQRNLPSLFVSSYTPTLGALIRVRQSRIMAVEAGSPTKRILVVGQADTPNENPLPKVDEEVSSILTAAPHAVVLQSTCGTREAVLAGIPNHDWLHLACHGHHDVKQPFRSFFSMHNGPITLLDLIEKDLPHAELAVLSACHSARVSETLPDEALHPAAGMMFAGYKSVIGTMWAFDDGFGSALAGTFYKLMLSGKKGHADAATTLAQSIQQLVATDKDAIPLMQRINVVHYGA